MTGPDAGVEVFTDDVSESAFDDYLEGDRGVFQQELAKDRLADRSKRRTRHGQAKMAGRLVTEHVYGFDDLGEPRQDRPQLEEQPLADLGRRDAPGGPIEEADTELFVEVPDHLAKS